MAENQTDQYYWFAYLSHQPSDTNSSRTGRRTMTDSSRMSRTDVPMCLIQAE